MPMTLAMSMVMRQLHPLPARAEAALRRMAAGKALSPDLQDIASRTLGE